MGFTFSQLGKEGTLIQEATDMFEPLEVTEQRVLGCLMEKQMSTPEYYPLTLNALVNACNQSTNRDPVMSLLEGDVSEALLELKDRQVVWFVDAAGSRARKYEHRMAEAFDLSIQEAAILAELLLRQAQTPGELRNRCTRMYAFQDLQEVEAALALMLEAEVPLIAPLPRQPGTKETRYVHLLGKPIEESSPSPVRPAARTESHASRLEGEVDALRVELASLREAFETFKKQFD